MQDAIGLLEVSNLATAIICTDEMLKSAYVDIYDTQRIGSGIVTMMIKGELASVKEAIQIGEEIASRYGGLLTSKVIAKPYVKIDQLTK